MAVGHNENTWGGPIEGKGGWVSLVPLEIAHEADLITAVKDGRLWELWYARVPSPEGMRNEIERRLDLQAKGRMQPFTVLDRRGRVVGMTSYQMLDPVNRRVEIGYTWYAKSVQNTPLNTEAKLLLLRHAFERLGCIAVGFTTSTFNHQSRRAIERLGAKLDGVLRNHSILPDGTLRDTCYYSIIESEWPSVKRHLIWKLDNYRTRE